MERTLLKLEEVCEVFVEIGCLNPRSLDLHWPNDSGVTLVSPRITGMQTFGLLRIPEEFNALNFIDAVSESMKLIEPGKSYSLVTSSEMLCWYRDRWQTLGNKIVAGFNPRNSHEPASLQKIGDKGFVYFKSVPVQTKWSKLHILLRQKQPKEEPKEKTA